MKIVPWTDSDGKKHQSLIREGDPDSMAETGIPNDPPDLNQLDWNEIERELHNRLIEAGLITWRDVQRSQNGLTGIVRAVVLKRIIQLYKLREVDNGN
jgi:hypothetical protein